MLAKRGADKNRGNVGAHGEQIINQLRYAVVIEARQRFEDIQAGGFPKVIHFSGLTMLNGQPAVTGQTLQYFAQGCAGDTDQLRKLAFSGENRSRREAVIQILSMMYSSAKPAGLCALMTIVRFPLHSVTIALIIPEPL